jgi:ABC-type uncharacterized transport system permease subunit
VQYAAVVCKGLFHGVDGAIVLINQDNPFFTHRHI